MYATFCNLIGMKAQSGNPATLQSGTMAQARTGHDTVGRRARSGTAPGSSRREVTADTQGLLTSALSITPPSDASQPPSRAPLRAAQQNALLQIDETASRLKHTVKLNASLKEQARWAEADLTSAIQQRDALQVMLTEYEQREQFKNGELLQAKADIQHLNRCLDDCKERIFKMQPLEHMTDSEIANQYRTLCESISDWTDGQFGDYDNPLSLLDVCPGKETPGKLVHEYLIRDHLLEVAKKYPSAACAMITYLIHRHVYQSVLREDLCFPGLDGKCEDFVSFIANAMRNNEPRRDEDAIGLWLTEVQRTLSNSTGMKSVRETYLHNRCSELEEMLRMLLPADQKAAFHSQELRKFFAEAADLAKNVRLSPATYYYQCRCNVGASFFGPGNHDFKIIDQASAQLVRTSDTFKVTTRDGRIGEMLCVVQPALVRKGKNGGRDITLVKATILCNLDHPVVRRKKTKQVSGGGLEGEKRA